MRRRPAVLLALAAALGGCPLPQPLPDYKEGQTVTPPRILADVISVNGIPASSQAVLLVPAECPNGREPTYELSAQIHDTNNIEQVEARWFVNYSPTTPYDLVLQSDTIPPDPNPLVLVRVIPPNDGAGSPHPWVFEPYQHPAPLGALPCTAFPNCKDAYVLRVVELVVSNGFFPRASEPPATPNRTPMPSFETQVYRWIFLTVPAKADADPCIPAEDPTCVKCPPAP